MWGGETRLASSVPLGFRWRKPVVCPSAFPSCPAFTPVFGKLPFLFSLLAKDPWGNVSPDIPPPSLKFHCPTSPSHLSSPMSLTLGLLLASDQLICAKMLITLGLNQSSSVSVFLFFFLNISPHHVFEIHNNSPFATLSSTHPVIQLPMGRGIITGRTSTGLQGGLTQYPSPL